MTEAFELKSNHDTTKVDQTQISNASPMTADTTLVASEWAAMQADTVVLNLAKTYTDDRTVLWVDGVQKQARKVALLTGTVASGNVIFYPTDDNTATGNAIFTTIYSSYIFPKGSSTTADYLFGVPTIAGNKKSITIAVMQITNILVLTLATAANGAVINVVVYGE